MASNQPSKQVTQRYLQLDLCSKLSEQILEGFVLGLQLGTPLSIQKSLVEPTKFLESLSSPESCFHVTLICLKS